MPTSDPDLISRARERDRERAQNIPLHKSILGNQVLELFLGDIVVVDLDTESHKYLFFLKALLQL